MPLRGFCIVLNIVKLYARGVVKAWLFCGDVVATNLDAIATEAGHPLNATNTPGYIYALIANINAVCPLQVFVHRIAPLVLCLK